MKIKDFLSCNLKFEDSNLNKTTKFLNSQGNHLLSPARHLLKGQTVTCVLVPSSNRHAYPLFWKINEHHPQGVEKVCKTVLSLAFLVPGLLTGSALKGTALLCSDRLRRRYHLLDMSKLELQNKIYKAAHEICISLYKKDAAYLFNLLIELKVEGLLDEFLAYFAGVHAEPRRLGGNMAYLREYPNLYTVDGKNRIIDKATEQVISCYLKLFADRKILITEFFSKLRLLDTYADKHAKKFKPIQNHINLQKSPAENTPFIEQHLRSLNFFSFT